MYDVVRLPMSMTVLAFEGISAGFFWIRIKKGERILFFSSNLIERNKHIFATLQGTIFFLIFLYAFSFWKQIP